MGDTKMKWSEKQWQAITSDNTNLLVAAAAGSGKTAVLVERIIKHLTGEGGVDLWDIDRLLVVTFTRAAAAEMRGRIEKRIQKAISNTAENLAGYQEEGVSGNEVKRDEQLLQRLEKQLIMLSNANISTLHSFCQTLIRQNFAAIDIDPGFRMGNTQELELICQDAIEAVFEEFYEQKDEDFVNFTNAYGNDMGDGALYEYVLKLYHFVQSNPFPDEWLERAERDYDIDDIQILGESGWTRVLAGKLAETIKKAEADSKKLMELAQSVSEKDDKYAPFYVEVAASDMANSCQVLEGLKQGWDQMIDALNSLSFKSFAGKRNTDKKILGLHNEIKKSLLDLQKDGLENLQGMLEDVKASRPYVRTLIKLVRAFTAEYQLRKSEKNILDFNDLEHMALNILMTPESTSENLIPSEIALELREHFQEVMVDEYQDTNGVQEAIISLVTDTDKGRLFLVGDVKQSIYRFRLTSPAFFREKYESYPELEKQGKPYKCIDLSQNFRSRKEILHSVNFVFSLLMTKGSSGIDYDEAAALNPGLEYAADESGCSLEGPMELDIIDGSVAKAEGIFSDVSEDIAFKFQLEAIHIAKKLRKLKDSGAKVYDSGSGSYRPIEWRDMAVLLRTRSGNDDLLEALRAEDIPAYASGDSGYFEANEIRVMTSVLSVVDNACQDIPLAAVLYSPIGGFTAGELSKIRLLKPDGELVECLRLARGDMELAPAIRNKAIRITDLIDQWHNLSHRAGVPELIWQIYRDTGYYEYVGGMPGGLLRQANLRMLADRAEAYEKTDYRGLFRFLRFIEKMKNNDTDLSVARTLSDSENVVRIMTIHQSKGLEFPVVVLADAGHGFNDMDVRQEPFLFHSELGIGIRLVDRNRSLKYPIISHKAISRQTTVENRGEELRVLYVAMTRAREKLIITTNQKDVEKKADSWCSNLGLADETGALPAYTVINSKNYMDWIGIAAVHHPDGGELRNLAENLEIENFKTPAYGDKCHMAVRVIPASELGQKNAEENAEGLERIALLKNEANTLPESPDKEQVERILAWPIENREKSRAAALIPSKLSVTEIKRRFAQEEEAESPGTEVVSSKMILKRPRFLQTGRVMTGTEYGTVMHSVMQHVDFNGDLSVAGIKAQLDEMVDREILMPEHRSLVRASIVSGFFSSAIGKRVLKASSGGGRVWRELPFSRMVPAKLVYPELSEDAGGIFSQGIIDLLFEENDGLVLVDYKTDGDTEPKAAAERYKIQIELYSRAVEAIMGKKIKERYLYMLHDGTVISM